MRRHLQLFFQYFLQYFKVRVSYRADFLIGLATSIAASLFAFAFVLILFRRAHIAGWNFWEIIFLFGFSMIPFGIFNVLSLNIYEFGGIYIMEGKFDRVLLRPVSSLFQVLFEAFRIESFHEVITGTIIVAWASGHLQHHWNALDIVLLILFGLCGGVIYISFFLLLSTVSFWFEDRIGVHPPFWNMIAFGRYPLSIYSGYIQFLLSWIIPFGFASFYPAVRLLHRSELRSYAPLAPLVTAAMLGITLFAWSRGVRHYSSTGS